MGSLDTIFCFLQVKAVDEFMSGAFPISTPSDAVAD
jgi:hypothetical protein